MELFSVGIFFVVIFGLGALIASLVKKSKPTFFDVLIYPGLGLCAFVLLSIIFTLIHVPLDWKIFAAAGVGGIVLLVFLRKDLLPEIKPNSSWFFHVSIVVLVIGMFFVYHTGAFSYPYLENDDSWGHAASTLYIAEHKTLLEPDNTYDKLFDIGAFQYIDPYPPGYDSFFGVFAQLERVSWTLKFFNALIISLGYLFFYAFAALFFKNVRKAFLATIVLLALPAYFSHFIWAISLAIPIYFISLYCLERMRENHWWGIPLAVSVAAGLLSSPTHSIYFVIFIGAYVFGRVACERKLSWFVLGSLVSGALISFVLWWGPMLVRYKGMGGVLARTGLQAGNDIGHGTGDRAYSLADFFIARNQNMINAPVGLGFAACILLVVGIFLILRHGKSLLKPEWSWAVVTSIWFALMLYAVNASNFAIKLSAFRTWMLLAIPVAIFCAVAWDWLLEFKGNLFWIFTVSSAVFMIGYNQFASSVNLQMGYYSLPALSGVFAVLSVPLLFCFGWVIWLSFKRLGFSVRRISIIVFLIVFFILAVTSFIPKYEVNTAKWYPGGTWLSEEEFNGYLTLNSLPSGSRVFSLTYRHAANIIGLDKYTCLWCQADIDFRQKTGSSDVTVDVIYYWLKENKYDYVIVDSDYALINGINATNQRISDLIGSGKFQPYSGTPGFVMLKVL